MTSDDALIGLVHFNHQELPSGEVAWITPGTGHRNPNYGDMLVCAAILRQLDTSDTVRVNFGGRAETPVQAAVLRGSTYLNRQFDFQQAIRTIESLDAPVAAVGLGAQAPLADVSFLDDVPEARRFVALLAERSASISARGKFTAAVLERLGAPNIRITGCPSMFYSLAAPRVALPEGLEGQTPRLGISLHTGLSRSRFCRNVAATQAKHNRLISFALRVAAEVSLFEQGVMREYIVGDATRPMSERVEAARVILGRFPDDTRLRPGDLIDHVVSVNSVEDWLARAGSVDAMLGFRFHGNMVALTQGIPCYYYLYDSRITEFCELYRLPHAKVEQAWRNPLTAIVEHDWDVTTTAIQGCFDELVAFYDENAIQHHLRPASGVARDRQS